MSKYHWLQSYCIVTVSLFDGAWIFGCGLCVILEMYLEFQIYCWPFNCYSKTYEIYLSKGNSPPGALIKTCANFAGEVSPLKTKSEINDS